MQIKSADRHGGRQKLCWPGESLARYYKAITRLLLGYYYVTTTAVALVLHDKRIYIDYIVFFCPSYIKKKRLFPIFLWIESVVIATGRFKVRHLKEAKIGEAKSLVCWLENDMFF